MYQFDFRPVCSMLYYGVSMNTNFLGGDLYLTFIFGGLSEFPALFLTSILVDKIGRKPVLVGGFVTAATAMLSSLILDGEGKNCFGVEALITPIFSLSGNWHYPVTSCKISFSFYLCLFVYLYTGTFPNRYSKHSHGCLFHDCEDRCHNCFICCHVAC